MRPGPQPFKLRARGNRSLTATGGRALAARRAGGRAPPRANDRLGPAASLPRLPNQQLSCRPPLFPAHTPPHPPRAPPLLTTRAKGQQGRGSPQCVWASAEVARSPGVSNTAGPPGRKKNTRAAANGSAERTRALPWPRPALLERSSGPAIGSRSLSLAAAASRQGPCGDWFRPGAKCNAGKAEQGPRWQVVTFRGSAP